MIELPTNLPWVALDTETSGLHPDDGARVACVALACRDWSVALPFDQGVRDKITNAQMGLDLFGQGVDFDPNLPVEDWEYLLRWCKDQKLVFQNAKYDLIMMRAGTRHWPGVDLIDQLHWDTMLVSGILDPLHPRGLDATCQRLEIGTKQNVEALKEWLSKNGYPKGRYDLVPWDIVEAYVTGDAEMTGDLYEMQVDRISQLPAPVAERVERAFNLTRSLYAMECRGISYDDIRSMEAADELLARAAKIEQDLPFKCTPQSAGAYFFGQLKLEPKRVSDKTGKPSMDEQQVREWIADGVPWAEEYSLVMRARRSVSMWYQGWAEKVGTDGRLRTTFKQGEVKSGRMSVSRTQLQAIPKKDKYSAIGSDTRLPIYEGIPDVRELLYAPEGRGIWNLDLSQAELRVAAQYSRCVPMLDELLSDDSDIHSKTTINVMGADPTDPMFKFKRDIGKRLTFGGIFMVGADTFQETLAKLADIHLPIKECARLVYRWRMQYPQIEKAYRKAERMAEEKGYVRILPNTPYEYRSYFKPEDWSRTAWNRIVQGSLAEAFGIWLGEIEQRWPGYLVLTIHDSVMLEADLDEGDRIAKEIAAFGAEMFTDLFGIEMRVDIDRW